MPLVTLDHISHAYGHLPLLDDVSLQIQPGERLALIGRNGTGKSTLMQIVSGELAPDAGTVWRDTGVQVARLVQDVPLDTHDSVFDVVAQGLGDLAAIIAAYGRSAAGAVRFAVEITPDLPLSGRGKFMLVEQLIPEPVQRALVQGRGEVA